MEEEGDPPSLLVGDDGDIMNIGSDFPCYIVLFPCQGSRPQAIRTAGVAEKANSLPIG